jgi:hypothetical protein
MRYLLRCRVKILGSMTNNLFLQAKMTRKFVRPERISNSAAGDSCHNFAYLQ